VQKTKIGWAEASRCSVDARPYADVWCYQTATIFFDCCGEARFCEEHFMWLGFPESYRGPCGECLRVSAASMRPETPSGDPELDSVRKYPA